MSTKKAADFAPGLPSKSDMGHADKLRVGQMLDYIVQKHNAERAGEHYDVRFGNPEMGLLSWASRKGAPEPGQKHLAIQQPVHRHEYKDFEGEIPQGYGKGTVKTHEKGQVLLTKVTPNSIHFTTAHQRHPERFTLARPKGWGNKNWLLMNTSPRGSAGYEKLHYKSIPPEQVEPALAKMQDGTLEAKVDGASQLVRLAGGHAESLSYRTSRTTGRPISHTERFFQGRPEIKVPSALEGSVLKGELYAADPQGRAGTAQDVSTLLNSSLARSLELQKERGLTLRNMLYDVAQYGKKPIDPNVTSRDERRRMLEEIAAHLPADRFHVSEAAQGPEATTKLWNMIQAGAHPLTREGAILWPGQGPPVKAKIRPEHDVVLTGTYPGTGKRQATIGGFTWGHPHEPGKTVGRVGTGLSDSLLREAARDPGAYVGRMARLQAHAKLPSGALREPSFISLHEDINPDQGRGQVRPVGGDRPRAKQAGVPQQLVDLSLQLRDGEGHQELLLDREGQDSILRLFGPRTKSAAVAGARSVSYEGQHSLEHHDPAVYQQRSRELSSLRRPRYQGLQTLAEVRGVPGGYGPATSGPDYRAEKQRRSILPGQLQVGDQVYAGAEPAKQPTPDGRRLDVFNGGLGGTQRGSIQDYSESTGQGLFGRGRGVADLVSGTTVAKLAGLYDSSWNSAPGIPDEPNDPGSSSYMDTDIRRRRQLRQPRPAPSWLDSFRQMLMGDQNALLPDIVKKVEEDQGLIVAASAGTIKRGAAVDPVTAGPITPELPPNPFTPFMAPKLPSTPNYPSPTAAAVKQLSAPSLPALPTGRAGPALGQVHKVVAANPTGADRLQAALHGQWARQALTTASRKAGYPADPGAAPASTVALLGRTLPHQLPPTRFESRPTAGGSYDPATGQVSIIDPIPWMGSGPAPRSRYSFADQFDMLTRNNLMPNRLGIMRHETEHALQDIYTRIPRNFPRSGPWSEYQKAIDAARRWSVDRENATEIPPSLGDLPFMAQAHKLETGQPLNVDVNVAPGITHNADWMARQAEQHGMFRGRTTTELLATPAGQAYLQRLMRAYSPGLEKQNQYKKAEIPRGPEDEYCPHCDARQERGDDGFCNRCGKPWPEPKVKKGEAHPALADLKRAKTESDRKNYPAKHHILSQLLDKHPGEFVQDSAKGRMVGLTHPETGFKIHAPADVVRGRASAQPVYHGSWLADIKKLEPRPSRVLGGEKAVFGTPDRDLAISFGQPWHDEDFQQGYHDRQPYMREQYPGAFKKIFGGKSGTLYQLPDRGFASDPRLMREERISRKAVKPAATEHIPDILAALRSSRFEMYPYRAKVAGWQDWFSPKPEPADLSEYEFQGPHPISIAEGVDDRYSQLSWKRHGYLLHHKPTGRNPAYIGYYSIPKGGSLVTDLNTAPDQRGRGLARHVMKEFLARHGNEDILLEPEPYGHKPADLERLKAFYRTQGFIDLPGESENFMGRHPTSLKQAAALPRAIQDLQAQMELVGSRGRARRYGRPEPEGADFDFGAFVAPGSERNKLKGLMKQLRSAQSFAYPDTGSEGISYRGNDYTIHPPERRKAIDAAWALQEQGVPKHEAWARVTKQAAVAGLLRYFKTAASPWDYVRTPLNVAGDVLGRVGNIIQGGVYGGAGATLGSTMVPVQGAGRLGQTLGIPGSKNLTDSADAFVGQARDAAQAGVRDIGSQFMTTPAGHIDALDKANRALIKQTGGGALMEWAHRGAGLTGWLSSQAMPSLLMGAGMGVAGRAAKAMPMAEQVAPYVTPTANVVGNIAGKLGYTGNAAAPVQGGVMAVAKQLGGAMTPTRTPQLGQDIYEALPPIPKPSPMPGVRPVGAMPAAATSTQAVGMAARPRPVTTPRPVGVASQPKPIVPPGRPITPAPSPGIATIGGGLTTKRADLQPWVSLQPQQKRVAKRVGEGQNLLVYHGLGSGKSLAGIAAAEGVGGPYTAIVPASLRPNYEGEISKFSDRKTPSEVMSYTGVGMGRQPRQDPDTVIMDEVQRLRNPASEGSRAAMDLAMKAKHKILLSGTPIVNAPSDLAVPLSILTGDEMSPASFNKQFVGTKTVDPGLMGWFQGIQPAKVPTIQDEQGLEKLLENHVDYQPSRTPEGVHTKDERVEVDLSPEQQDFYKLMWGKLPWMTRWKLSNDYPLSGPELSHLSSFMTGPRQAALSLYPYHSSKDPMYAFKTSSKLQAAMGSLKETLAKNPKAKALVYSNFIDAGLTPYGAALQAEGIPFGQFHGTMSEEDRKRALADYNEGRSRVLLLGPAAAEGISAKGTQLIQLLDPHWNEARMGQARGRGLRFDSHEGLPEELRNVKIQRFIAKMPPPGWFGRLFGAEHRPTADEVLEQESRRKEALNEQFRDVLRRVGSPGYQRPWSLFG